MNEIPATPAAFLAALLGGGTLYGLVSTWLIDAIIRAWERRVHGRISATKRRWVSIGVAVAVPVAAYLGLTALGAAPWSVDSLYNAAMVGVAAVGGSKISYAARESKSKPGEDPAYRRANDASGDPDLPNGGHVAPRTHRLPDLPGGGHTLVAGPPGKAPDLAWFPTPERAPSPPPVRGAPAPAAEGAPLVEQLAADLGLAPEPEDIL